MVRYALSFLILAGFLTVMVTGCSETKGPATIPSTKAPPPKEAEKKNRPTQD